VVCLRLPRLRERGGSIPLPEYFLSLFQKKFEKKRTTEQRDDADICRNLDWPGNIRDLSNGIAAMCFIGPEASIVQEPIVRQRDNNPGESCRAGTIPLDRSLRKPFGRGRETTSWNRCKPTNGIAVRPRGL